MLLDYDTMIKAPEYLAINPMGKVPALKHGDTVITEVAAYVGWYLQFKLLDARPAFVAFAERHNQRPAKQRADEIDSALLAQAAQPAQ